MKTARAADAHADADADADAADAASAFSASSNSSTLEYQPENRNEHDQGQIMFSSLDPLDPRRVSLDLFELYSYEMIMTQDIGRRVFLIKKMRVSLC